MKKKGLLYAGLLALVLALAALIVLSFFLFDIRTVIEFFTEKNICKSSALTQHLLSIKHADLLNQNIKCPTIRTKIGDRDQEKIKSKIGQLYYQTCNDFGQGKLDLFGRNEGTFCVVRHLISFQDTTSQVIGMTRYLNEQKIPGKQVSYLQYCAGYETKDAPQIIGSLDLPPLNLDKMHGDKQYAIIFITAKGQNKIKQMYEFMVGTDASHATMYAGAAAVAIGIGIMSAGSGLTATVVGSFVGIPVIVIGVVVTTIGAVWTYIASNVRPEYASFFLIREYNVEELRNIKCDILPAEQS